MSTKINKTENLDAAKTAVQKYRTTCDDLFRQLKTAIDNVRATNFIGDASNGYQVFFDAMTPALTTNLTSTEGSVTSMLEQILDAVAQMNMEVDPQMGTANEKAASGETTAPAVK